MVKKLAMGFEPTTCALRKRCSTVELGQRRRAHFMPNAREVNGLPREDYRRIARSTPAFMSSRFIAGTSSMFAPRAMKNGSATEGIETVSLRSKKK